MSRVLAILESGACSEFACFSRSHLTRLARSGVLRDVTNFAKGALIGGIVAVAMFPAPIWYDVIDLLAYIPAAWIGAKLGGAGRQ